MSKTIPTLPSGGSQRFINVPGTNPNGGLNLPPAAQPGWPAQNAAEAAGQNSGVPDVTVQAPTGAIPGGVMNRPAESAPAFPTAGRTEGIKRESQ